MYTLMKMMCIYCLIETDARLLQGIYSANTLMKIMFL